MGFVNKYAREVAGSAYMRIKDDMYVALNCDENRENEPAVPPNVFEAKIGQNIIDNIMPYEFNPLELWKIIEDIQDRKPEIGSVISKMGFENA